MQALKPIDVRVRNTGPNGVSMDGNVLQADEQAEEPVTEDQDEDAGHEEGYEVVDQIDDDE